MRFEILVESRDMFTGEILPVGSFLETNDKERIAEAQRYGQIKLVESKKVTKKKSGD